jgi:hypothetical protein
MWMPERLHTGQVPVCVVLVAELVSQPVVGIRQTGELIDAGNNDDAIVSADGVDLPVKSVFGVAILSRVMCAGCSGDLSNSVTGGVEDAGALVAVCTTRAASRHDARVRTAVGCVP